MTSYRDQWIECTDEEIRIRGYYFPWGTKRIPYTSIRSVRRVDMGTLTGKGRIWGTGNLRYWASLDPRRPSKKVALILDLGRHVRPFLTLTIPPRSRAPSVSTPTPVPPPAANAAPSSELAPKDGCRAHRRHARRCTGRRRIRIQGVQQRIHEFGANPLGGPAGRAPTSFEKGLGPAAKAGCHQYFQNNESLVRGVGDVPRSP